MSGGNAHNISIEGLGIAEITEGPASIWDDIKRSHIEMLEDMLDSSMDDVCRITNNGDEFTDYQIQLMQSISNEKVEAEVIRDALYDKPIEMYVVYEQSTKKKTDYTFDYELKELIKGYLGDERIKKALSTELTDDEEKVCSRIAQNRLKMKFDMRIQANSVIDSNSVEDEKLKKIISDLRPLMEEMLKDTNLK